MARTLEGLTFLNSIIQLPTREVEPFRIIAKGYFDRKSYNEYIMGKNRLNISNIQDHSIFFKACPFVKSGFGCTLPPRYRTYVCNFFLCDEIIQSIKTKNCFEVYIRERERYVRWIEWENTSLMKILQEYKVDLIKDWEGSIRILQDIPLNIYEFPKLHPIVVDTGSSRGA